MDIHKHRSHISIFVGVLATATLVIAIFSYHYNLANATSKTKIAKSSSPAISTALPLIQTPIDTTPPTITLLGAKTIAINVGDQFNDPGAVASDDMDGDITTSITTTGKVDTSTHGIYFVTYTAKDAAGNTSSVIRAVVVNMPLPPDERSVTTAATPSNSNTVPTALPAPIDDSVLGNINVILKNILHGLRVELQKL